MMLVRTVKEDDAVSFLNLRKQLDAETSFMLLESDERVTPEEMVRQQIKSTLTQQNTTILVGEEEGRLVGFLSANGGLFRRNRHTAYLVIGILKSHHRQGLGKKLFSQIFEWAKNQGIHRLELSVMKHNQAALSLYQQLGFQIEGLKKENLYIDGIWIDEIFMAKLLD